MNPVVSNINGNLAESGFGNRGFTMIELLVVCSIIVILSVYVSANYRQGNRELALEMTAGKLAQDLRRAQEWGYSAHQFNGISYTGYGITLTDNGTTYALYTDDNGNGRYSSSGDTIRETTVMENGFKVDAIKPCGPADSCGTVASLSVNYVPPDPGTVVRDSGGNDYDEATIILTIEGTATTRAVVVNRAGLIYVQ